MKQPGLHDRYDRHLNYLRVGVTDRCQLACPYCRSGHESHLEREELLSFEEIVRACRLVSALGINRFRLTGGEPLLRHQVADLVAALSELPETADLSLTTNGVLLAPLAGDLARAGLRRVNLSLDTLNPSRFRELTGQDSLDQVLAGMEAALAAGMEPLKINVVLLAGVNQDEILDFALLARDPRVVVRFIELMPLGETSRWNLDHLLPAKIVIDTLGRGRACEPIDPLASGPGGLTQLAGVGPARYYRVEGIGTIGVISNVSNCFCEGCNRLRLTARGLLKPCLWMEGGVDLREMFRTGATDPEIARVVEETVLSRPRRRDLGRSPGYRMSEVGG